MEYLWLLPVLLPAVGFFWGGCACCVDPCLTCVSGVIADCSGNNFDVTVTWFGTTNGSCSDCSLLDGTWVFSNTTACSDFEFEGSTPVCGGFTDAILVVNWALLMTCPDKTFRISSTIQIDSSNNALDSSRGMRTADIAYGSDGCAVLNDTHSLDVNTTNQVGACQFGSCTVTIENA